MRFQDAGRVQAAVQSRESKREELRERVRRHVLADAGARAVAWRSRDRASSELARLRTREGMLEADEVSPKLIKKRQRRKRQIELPKSAEARRAFRKVTISLVCAPPSSTCLENTHKARRRNL